jgi:hypothetical protein
MTFNYSTPSVAGTLLSASVDSLGQYQATSGVAEGVGVGVGVGATAASHFGEIPENGIALLVYEIEAAIAEVVVADDTGTLEVNWIDSSGKPQSGSCTTAYGSLCADLVKRIEALFKE